MLDPGEVSQAMLMEYGRALAQWTRLSGSEDERAAAAYVEARLREAGYAVRTLWHDAYISLPGRATLEIVRPAPRAVPCITHSMGVSTPPGGVTAALVYAGKGGVDALTRAGTAGKFALVEGRATPQIAVDATRAGALGVVCISGRYPHEMCCSPVWGNPARSTAGELPRVHLFSVARADGEALREAAQAGAVVVHAAAEVRTGWTKTPIVLGDLAPLHPEADPNRFVLFSGHLDSWYVGAMDNGTANAAMLEVARVLAPRRRSLRRGLRLAFWSGHSHGRYSSSAWYADNHWAELAERCVLHVNIDSVGAIDADEFATNSMPQTVGIAAWAVAREAGAVLDGRRVGRNSDQSFLGIGIPSILGALSKQSDGSLGWWWHTPHDTPDKIDPVRLVRDARIFALALWRLLSDPVLPLDYRAAAADLREALEGLDRAAGFAFDLAPAIEAASRLETLAGRLARAAGSGRRRAAAAAVNACLQALGRILIPATYTSAGAHAHDPALETTFLPRLQPAGELALLDRESDAAKLLLVDLVRARNAVTDAIATACGRIEECLEELGLQAGAAASRVRRRGARRTARSRDHRARRPRTARGTAREKRGATAGNRRTVRRARPRPRRASRGRRRPGTSA